MCGFLLDGRNPAKFHAPERELQRLTLESGVCLEGAEADGRRYELEIPDQLCTLTANQESTGKTAVSSEPVSES